MSSAESSFDSFEQEFATYKARLDIIKMATNSWDSLRTTNEGLKISRRFIVGAGVNEIVPAQHERVTLHPRLRAGTISGINKVRIRAPFQKDANGAPTVIDTTQLFFEFEHASGLITRALLTEREYGAYVDAEDILTEETEQGLMYSTQQLPDETAVEPEPEDFEAVEFPPVATEYDNLRTLLELVTFYEPLLQDNYPSGSDRPL
jgi:hypothetical protein